MIELSIDQNELRKLERRIERLANVDTNRRKEIRAEARKIAQANYIAALKSLIRDYDREIVVKRKGSRIVIPPGFSATSTNSVISCTTAELGSTFVYGTFGTNRRTQFYAKSSSVFYILVRNFNSY